MIFLAVGLVLCNPLFLIRQPLPQVRDMTFNGIWAMDGPAMLPPVLKGDVRGIRLEGASLGGFEGQPTSLVDNTQPPLVAPASVDASFTYSSGILEPRQPVTFMAASPASTKLQYEWVFGDGSRALGHTVLHAFPDALGTDLDGSGRFRVALHVTDLRTGEQSWTTRHLVLRSQAPKPTRVSVAEGDHVYAAVFDVPADGGYTVTLLTSTKASLTIDDNEPALSPKPRPQVCGSPGNAVQPTRVSAVLNAGPHRLRVVRDDSAENADTAGPGIPFLLWEGPETPTVLRLQPSAMRQ